MLHKIFHIRLKAGCILQAELGDGTNVGDENPVFLKFAFSDFP